MKLMNHFTHLKNPVLKSFLLNLQGRIGNMVIFAIFLSRANVKELLFARFFSKSYISYEIKCSLCKSIKDNLANFGPSTNLCLLQVFVINRSEEVQERVTKCENSVLPCALNVKIFHIPISL